MRILLVVLALVVAGCSHKADVTATPAYDLVTSYSNQVPGKWLLYVEGEAMNTLIRPADINCSGHNYPVDIRAAFAGSVRQTLGNIVEQLEQVSSPPPPEAVEASGARGLIIVRGRELNGRLRVVPGFFSANIDGEISLVASMQVDGQKDRLFGQTFESRRTAQGDAGLFCSGASSVLGEATNEAMRTLSRELGEAFANSPSIRQGVRI